MPQNSPQLRAIALSWGLRLRGPSVENPFPKITSKFNERERLPEIPQIKINGPGLLKLLLNINPNKATGPDQIPGKFLKLCAYELVDIFQVLFQASLDQGVVPPD